MTLKSWRVAFAALLSLLSFVPTAIRAETRTAAALTPEAVWEAIDAAKDGDTVQLPAGTADWSKGWNTGRGAKMKAITIQGAGMDKTVICDRRSRRATSCLSSCTESKESRSALPALPSTDPVGPTPARRADSCRSAAPARISASTTASSRMPTR